MAIFKRLIDLTPRKASLATTSSSSRLDVSAAVENENEVLEAEVASLCWSPYKPLKRDMLRLVVFSEQDYRLLYDSDTVISTQDRVIQPSGCHKSSCGKFQFLPHAQDCAQIAKMVFGSLATSLKNDSMKIHSLLHINSLMISRVFSVPKPNKYSSPVSDHFPKCMASSMSSDSDTQSHYSTIRSLDAIRDECRSTKMTMSSCSFSTTEPPDGFARLRNSSLQLDISKESHQIEDFKSFSPNRLSRVRRRQMSLKGLCDESPSKLGQRSRINSNNSIWNEVNGESKRQYGFALIFPGEARDFIFQHILQVEKELLKLITQVHRAVLSKTQFFQLVYEGWTEFCASTCLLNNALRLKSPAWLSLTNPDSQDSTATEFCRILVRLSDQLDTKSTKFFLSTLLSSVLQTHLAWVASVAPPSDQSSCSYDRSLLLGTRLIDSRRNPYNAMLAQFLELSGGIGLGNNRFAKTVVVGEDPKLIAEILFVLSYFIRCSSVESKRKEAMTPESLSPLKSFADCESPLSENNGGMIIGTMDSPQPIINSYDRGQTSSLGPPPAKCRALTFGSNPNKLGIELMVDTLPTMNNGRRVDRVSMEIGSPQRPSTMMVVEEKKRSNEGGASDFGRSLLAGVCTGYSNHFVLSGIDKTRTKMEDALLTMHEDVKHPFGEPCTYNSNVLSPSTSTPSHGPIASSSSYSDNGGNMNGNMANNQPSTSANYQGEMPTIVGSRTNSQDDDGGSAGKSDKLDGETKKTVLLVADCSNFSIRMMSCDSCCHVEDVQVVSPSESIASLLEEFVELYKASCASTFLISFIEDRLSSLLAKSNVLVQMVGSESTNGHPDEIISMEHISSVLGCHCSDLRLILNVAGVYSPLVLSSVVSS